MQQPPMKDFFDFLAFAGMVRNIVCGFGFVTALLLLAYIFVPRLR